MEIIIQLAKEFGVSVEEMDDLLNHSPTFEKEEA